MHVVRESRDREIQAACELLQRASADLRRLRATRGRSQRTVWRIREASAVLAVAMALLGAPGLNAPVQAADPGFCFPNHINGFGLADAGTASSPEFADLDGDGDLDALIGSFDGNMIFFRNTGSVMAPAFAAPSTNPFGLADVGDRTSPKLADIDGDGDLDAFIGEQSGHTFFFLNTGSAMAPAFAAPSTNPFGLADVGTRSSPELADIDGDGDLDALIGQFFGNIVFFQNTGSAMAPAFAAPSTNPFGLADVNYHSAPELADIDGDGDLDAFIGEQSGHTFFFLNTGSAMAPAFAAPSANPFGLILVSSSNPELADIDGDGDLDALIGNISGHTVFFQNTGSAMAPAFRAPATNPFGLANVGGNGNATPAFADIDGDGDLDALIGQVFGDTVFFQNTGSAMAPAFAAPSTNPFGLTALDGYISPALADIDGDGSLDALIGDYHGNTIFFRNTGSAMAPAFAAPSTNPFGLANVGGNGHATPAFADIDGDGDLDALIGDYHGNTIFFRNTALAGAAFAAPSTNPFGLADVGSFSAPDLADVDGDGDLDALIGGSHGNTIFFRNTGSAMAPAFAAPSTNPFGLANVGARSSPELADIDGDGDLDALIGDAHGNTVFFDNACPVPPTPTATETATATHTSSVTETATATVTETPTPSPTDTPSAATCPLTPAGGCSTAAKSQLQLRDNADNSKDKLKWKFTGGPALVQSDFGDPLTTASYALCVYDDGVLKLEAQVGPSGTFWKASGSTGYLFSDKAGGSDGIAKVKLKGGAAGKSKLQVKGKGANLPMPAPVSGTQFFDNASGVTAQLFEQNGDCYQTAFAPGDAIKNDGVQFKAKK